MAQKKQWKKDKGGGNHLQQDFNKPFVATIKDKNGQEKQLLFDENWIRNKIEIEAVQYADKFGAFLANKLTTSQLRNFFGEVRRIQMQRELSTTDLFLLKPKLAYAARRQNGEGVKILKLVLDPALDVVCEAKDSEIIEDRFGRFVSFFEAILAYHKGYGGKDTGR